MNWVQTKHSDLVWKNQDCPKPLGSDRHDKDWQQACNHQLVNGLGAMVNQDVSLYPTAIRTSVLNKQILIIQQINWAGPLAV